MSEKLQLFIESYALWGEAVTAGVVAGAVCGFLGVYVILHRMVFVSAAMSQVSSLGVMIAFYLVQIQLFQVPHGGEGHEHSHSYEEMLPVAIAAVLTALFSVAMAESTRKRVSDRSKSTESLIGAVYLISTAGLLLLGDRITQGAHDVSNILFGNAVAVDLPHLIFFLMVSLPLFFAHLWLRKDLLFISFDPATAATLGYPVSRLRIFLLLSLGIVISVGTRTLGALPIFSFSVLPPMAALLLTRDLRGGFLLSAAIGGGTAFIGYFLSFMLSLPTGACMTAAAAGAWLISWGIRRVPRG